MKRTSTILAVMVMLAVLSSCAYGSSGFRYLLVPKRITGVDFASLEKLYQQAMYGRDKDGAHSGDPEAQYELGIVFYSMYLAAADATSSEADDSADILNSEAKAYAKTHNLEQAAYWLKRSGIWNGYIPAQFLLSSVYYSLGDHAASFLWLDTAAENGYSKAQAHRAYFYRLARKYDKALELAQKSADQGDAYGMYVMSEIYRTKNYSGYNKAKSDEWLEKAKKAGEIDPTIEIDK